MVRLAAIRVLAERRVMGRVLNRESEAEVFDRGTAQGAEHSADERGEEGRRTSRRA